MTSGWLQAGVAASREDQKDRDQAYREDVAEEVLGAHRATCPRFTGFAIQDFYIGGRPGAVRITCTCAICGHVINYREEQEA